MPFKTPFSRKKLPNRVVLSYTFDYVIIFILAGLFYSLDAVEPYHQHFALQNYTLQYPYAVHERVPIPLLLTCCVAVPAFVIAVYTLFIDGIYSHRRTGRIDRSVNGGSARRRKCAGDGKYKWSERLWELNCGLLGLLLAEGAAFVITGALKNATGKPRPDLIDRCQPKAGSVDPPVYGLSNHSICTQTDNSILKDGFRSFPSGHSSSAWAGLFYLSLYLAAKLHVLDNRGEVWKAFIVLIPTLGAALIAISRIMDARHHPFDVISGSMIGVLVAWAAYRQYFPPIGETRKKGRAYPIRTWGTVGQKGADGREKRVYDDEGTDAYSKMDDETEEAGLATGGMPMSPLPPQVTGSGPGSGNHFRDEITRLDTIRRNEIGPTSQLTGSSNPYVHPPLPGNKSNQPTRRNTRRHAYDEDDDSLSSIASGDSIGSDDARYERSRQPHYYGTQGYNSRNPYAVPSSTGALSPNIQVSSEETGYKSPNTNFGAGASTTGAGAPDANSRSLTAAGTEGPHEQGGTAPPPPVHMQ